MHTRVRKIFSGMSSCFFCLFASSSIAVEELSKSAFNNKYAVVYHGYSEVCDTNYYLNIQKGKCKPYSKEPFVAYKDNSNPDNIYYKAQRFDISGIHSLNDFLGIMNNNARNRVVYDAQYDHPSFDDTGETFCLQPVLGPINDLRSNEGGTNGLEYYMRHWSYTSVPQGTTPPPVVELEPDPSEADPDTHNEHNCSETSEKCSVRALADYALAHPEKLCVTKGRHAGFMDQLIENDNGGLEYDDSKVNEISYNLGLAATNTTGPVTAALFIGAEMAVLVAKAIGEAREDEPFYPVSQTYTWGALKRMAEQSIDAHWDSIKIRAYGIPEAENLQKIDVDDYYAGHNCESRFTATVKTQSGGLEGPIEYVQYCWQLETTEGTETFYSFPRRTSSSTVGHERFRLAANLTSESALIHYGVRAIEKIDCRVPHNGLTFDCMGEIKEPQQPLGEAAQICEEYGTRVPTLEELQSFMKAKGSQLQTAQGWHDGYYWSITPIDFLSSDFYAVNLQGEANRFYSAWQNYVTCVRNN